MFNWMCSKYSSRRSAIFPAGIYLFKGNNGNTRTNCKNCLQLAIKTPKQHQWHRFETLFLFPLLTDPVNAVWVVCSLWIHSAQYLTHLSSASRRLLVQNKQRKHQKNVWNLFKVNNKDERMTLMFLLVILNIYLPGEYWLFWSKLQLWS